MEFYVKTSEAQRAFKLLSVTAKVNTNEFDGQILIKTQEDSVLFLSNNGHSGISCEVPAKIVTAGSSTVIYSKIKSFIMTFSPWDGEIGTKDFHFVTKSPRLHVSATAMHLNEAETHSNLKLDQLKNSAFVGPVSLGEPSLILNSSVLKSAIDKGIYAIDASASNDWIKGIRIIVTKGSIEFVAANGKTVSNYTVTSEGNLIEGDHFLSHEFLMGLRRILVDDTQVFLEITKAKTIIAIDNLVFWAKSLSYKHYPQYASIFNKFDKEVEVDRETLLNGLASFVDVLDVDDNYRVSIEMDEERLALRTDSSLFEYPGITEKAIFSLDLDGKDLLNTLQSHADDTLRLKCFDARHGMIFESVGFENHRSFVTNLTPR